MTTTVTDRVEEAYLPRDPYSLERDFLANPLMSAVKLARYKFPARMLSKDDVVLDLGCGNGYGSYFFSFYARKVVGVDLHADLSAASRKLCRDNLGFVQADIRSLPAEILEGQFTAVSCIDVIEHFDEPDARHILHTAANILPRNGMMIVGTPNKYSQAYRAPHNMAQHLHEYEPDELKALCDCFFGRTILFSMNDELVHTGFDKLAWFLFALCFK